MRFDTGRRAILALAALLALVCAPSIFAEKSVMDGRGKSDDGGMRAKEPNQDADGNFRKAPTYARASYAWPYASGPYYGDVSPEQDRAPGVIVTQVGSFKLTSGDVDRLLPQELKTSNKLDERPAQYFIVQFAADAGAEALTVRETIEGLGGAIVEAMPVSALVARLTPAAHAAIAGARAVLALEPLHPGLKLDPTIGRTPLADPMKALSEVYGLDVRVFAGEDSQSVASALSALGATVKAIYPDTVVIEIHRSRLADVASIDAVSLVSESLEVRPHGEETTATMQTGEYGSGAVPFHSVGINGSGNGVALGITPQVLMVLDSGFQLDAGDLSDCRATAGTPGGNHRKVRLNQSTAAFGGSGDTSGCDNPQQGGFTHGHVVAATALGNATTIVGTSLDCGAYGAGWTASDLQNNPWDLDGVAPGAVLIGYDGQITPANVSCSDPLQDTISPGDLYSGGATGALGTSYASNARVVNFSWGADNNAYTSNASDVDQFIRDKGDAMVFISAGNQGADDDLDGIPDELTLGTPATTKNGLAIGASRNALAAGASPAGPESRAFFSSVGPAVSAAVNRIAPQLMAPGDEPGGGNLGLASEFSCRSNDNDQANPVRCDVISGVEGTSFSAPAAAGSALLVRDYFQQGFYPTGAQVNGNRVANISGALVKALLISSADFMTGFNVTKAYRFNNEQGYGRIQLDNVLPLETWPPSPTGLIVADGGLIAGGGVNNLGLSGTINVITPVLQSSTFVVCDPTDELRVALAWVENASSSLVNDLNLEVQAPSGKIYYGNYFTDDNNRNGVQDALEDCPGITGASGSLDEEQWSLPTCANSPRDTRNPTEGIFLSPDADGDGVTDPNPANDNQIEVGTWTIRVNAVANGAGDAAQRYAVAVTGGVCLGSSIQFDQGAYSCNSKAKVAVSELDAGGDPAGGLTPAVISSRTTVKVFDSSNVEQDSETGLSFTVTPAGSLRFESAELTLSDSTARQPGNGVLDVRDGDTVKAIYSDTTATRNNSAAVNCRVGLGFGSITFAQFGTDVSYLVDGGCERNARGLFEFGFPDRYIDEGELVSYRFAFNSTESTDLENVQVSLRCVDVDGDSPVDCLPSTTPGVVCADPRRTNNTSCNGGAGADWLTILDSPKGIGTLTAGSAISANFAVQASSTINGPQTIEMVLGVSAETSGKSVEAVGVIRHKVDADENSTFYSTDFPLGGTIVIDRNNNEVAENPTTNLGDFLEDYRFESKTYVSLLTGTDAGGASVARNSALQSPWHFDNGNGGFTSGLVSVTDEGTVSDIIAQWGEDKNFNNILDGQCRDNPILGCNVFPADPVCPVGPNSQRCDEDEDRDIGNGVLDANWGTLGGCGWQTRAPGSCSGLASRGCHIDRDCLGLCRNPNPLVPSSNNACSSNANCTLPETCVGFNGTCNTTPQATGGAWHTGRISSTTNAICMVNGANVGQCQRYEIVSGTTGAKVWWELLATPVMQKVNQQVVAGEPTHTIEIVDWQWNMALDLTDNNVGYTWEFDTNSDELEPADLYADGGILNSGFGAYGAVTNSGNPDLTDGFPLFAAISRCAGNSRPCIVDSDCVSGQGPCTYVAAQSLNGTAGGNRVGKNSCFFNSIPATARPDVGLAIPLDDDTNQDGDGSTDEFVTRNGPMRNGEIFDWNGPDMRFTTLEDIYGETGTRFQAAIGFINFETTDSTSNPAQVGYGLAVDDMVVEWREYNLIQDAVDCAASGSCATLQLDTTNVFGGQASIAVTLLETTPYGISPPPGPFVDCVATPGNAVCENDCNLDGDWADGSDDNDCDNNGTPDVVVKASSDVEAAGEIIALNRTAPGVYKGDLPVSSSFNAAGVLFVSQLGTDAPVVTVRYNDWQDGTTSLGFANKCLNDADPLAQGQVEVATTVFLETGSITVVRGVVDDLDGDLDDFADTNETVDLRLVVRNSNLTDVRNLTAQISTNDPKIDCVLDSFILIGDVAPRTTVTSGQAFRFKIANVNRSTVNEDFAVTFNVTMASDNFDALSAPQSVTIDLDYDVTNAGSGPTSFLETFETASAPPNIGAAFIQENLDFGRNNFPGSDGYRCQYSDPDWISSNSYGAISDCFLGASGPQADATFWNRTTDRAFAGAASAYYGINLGGALGFTTPLAVLEAIRTANPVNLSTTASSELVFKHQTSLMDNRGVNAQPGRTAGRAVVAVQRADAGGAAVGNWLRMVPYLNTYDQQTEDNYTNCFFDPVDDGNDEDDFFDPTDPDRRLGPSSTCFPEFVFSHQGSTEGAFSVGAIGLASEGPGLAGVGVGTWIESKVDLSRFRGQRIRVRFLTTDLKGGSAASWEAIFQNNPDPADDGMWIDNVEVTNTLTTAATLGVDADVFAGTPCAGTACGTVTPSVTSTPSPATLAAPGQVLELDASASTADRCLGGTLQYRFCISSDNDCDDAGDTILRSWSDNPILIDAPTANTSYVVEVRCSSLVSCKASVTVNALVNCPGAPSVIKFSTAFNPASTAVGENTIAWTSGQLLTVDWVKGNFTTPASIGTFAEDTCEQTTGTSIDLTSLGTPGVNSGFYFLVRRDGTSPNISAPALCNDVTWTNFPASAGEASRDGSLNTNPIPGPGCP